MYSCGEQNSQCSGLYGISINYMEWHAHLEGEDVQDSASSEHPKWGLGRGGGGRYVASQIQIKKKNRFFGIDCVNGFTRFTLQAKSATLKSSDD